VSLLAGGDLVELLLRNPLQEPVQAGKHLGHILIVQPISVRLANQGLDARQALADQMLTHPVIDLLQNALSEIRALAASEATSDVISVIALSDSPCDITVSIGGSSKSVSATDSIGKAYYYQVPFDGLTGAVTITFKGNSTTGPDITSSPASGSVNFNAVTIQV
jgi:hypothetical protein